MNKESKTTNEIRKWLTCEISFLQKKYSLSTPLNKLSPKNDDNSNILQYQFLVKQFIVINLHVDVSKFQKIYENLYFETDENSNPLKISFDHISSLISNDENYYYYFNNRHISSVKFVEEYKPKMIGEFFRCFKMNWDIFKLKEKVFLETFKKFESSYIDIHEDYEEMVRSGEVLVLRNIYDYVTNANKKKRLINLTEGLVSGYEFSKRVLSEEKEIEFMKKSEFMEGRIGHAVFLHEFKRVMFFFGGYDKRGFLSNSLVTYDMSRESFQEVNCRDYRLPKLAFASIHVIFHRMPKFRRLIQRIEEKEYETDNHYYYRGRGKVVSNNEVVECRDTNVNDYGKLQLIIIGGRNKDNQVNRQIFVYDLGGSYLSYHIDKFSFCKTVEIGTYLHRSLVISRETCIKPIKKKGTKRSFYNSSKEFHHASDIGELLVPKFRAVPMVLVCGGLREDDKFTNKVVILTVDYETWPDKGMMIKLANTDARGKKRNRWTQEIVERSDHTFSVKAKWKVETLEIDKDNQISSCAGGGTYRSKVDEDLVFFYGGYSKNPNHNRFINIFDVKKMKIVEKIVVNEPVVRRYPFTRMLNDSLGMKRLQTLMCYLDDGYMLKLSNLEGKDKIKEDSVAKLEILGGFENDVNLSITFKESSRMFVFGGGTLKPELSKEISKDGNFDFRLFFESISFPKNFVKRNSISIFERDYSMSNVKTKKKYYKNLVQWTQMKEPRNLLFHYNSTKGKGIKIYGDKFFVRYYPKLLEFVEKNGTINEDMQIVIDCNETSLAKYSHKMVKLVLDFLCSNCMVFSINRFKEENLYQVFELSKLFGVVMLEKMCKHRLTVDNLKDLSIFRMMKTNSQVLDEFLEPKKLILFKEWNSPEFNNKFGIVQFIIKLPSDEDEDYMKTPLSPCLHKLDNIFDRVLGSEGLDEDLEIELRKEFEGVVEEGENLSDFFVIHAHKSLLKIRSSFFTAMWPKSEEMEEEGEEDDEVFVERKTNRVRMDEQEIGMEGLGLILKYFYTDSIESLDAQKCVSVYMCCRKMELKHVFPYIRVVMKKNIDIETVLPMLYIADLYSDEDILNFSSHFLLKNYKDILNEEQNKEYFDSFSEETKRRVNMVALKSYPEKVKAFMKMKKLNN